MSAYPTITGGAGLGSGGTATMTGIDAFGSISITTGTGASGSFVGFTISFAGVVGTRTGAGPANYFLLVPVNSAARAASPSLTETDADGTITAQYNWDDNTTYTWAYKLS